ncbi:MAG: glutamine--fructose-6-phosphate transaminase (isomerizing) [Dictyoglomus sp.]|nr:glutamine--fructose-6-phosphate transaminase (isomerizing) [Dictyoglomus sp.]MCX7941813.1 glutamine--fructose-6-phosphate transaminase (isomerizing) [Dictyoglomaceae bacterium]MDW8188084.1 glutamine--fructose-6-phosphate transaminase (isomerizing) [Dictyoglomus sp.]
MCGIIGYVGKNTCIPFLINGLKMLEYRGYDSAGIATLVDGEVIIKKVVGKVKQLEEIVDYNEKSYIGVGHTRWATHGEPTIDNAHPHMDCNGRFIVVHNGIIENYKELKDYLIAKGHKFRSQTDTEVIVHLIEEEFLEENIIFSFKKAIEKLEGSFALVILDKKNPTTLYVIKRQSPLIVGLGEEEIFVASDIPALSLWVENYIFPEDDQLVILSPRRIEIYNLKNNLCRLNLEPVKIPKEKISVDKGSYPHYMLKEIYEQPAVLREIFTEAIEKKGNLFFFKDFEEDSILWKKINKIFVVACGTSYHAGYFAKYLWEEELPYYVEVDYSSEFRYRKPKINENTLFIAISQSGETADTIAALRLAKEKGAKILSLTNNPRSTIARESDFNLFLRSGIEIGVAATKTFIAELAFIYLLKEYIKQRLYGENGVNWDNLRRIPVYLEKILSNSNSIKEIAYKYSKMKNFLYIARGRNFPLILEGALKLKEISYIHAEGVSAGEMKHGPIALLDKNTPVMAIAVEDETYNKIFSNLEEVKARKAPIIAIASEGDKKILDIANDVIYIPKFDPKYYPFFVTIPLQLFAYYVAEKLEREIDQPRNLAKSVTVE